MWKPMKEQEWRLVVIGVLTHVDEARTFSSGEYDVDREFIYDWYRERTGRPIMVKKLTNKQIAERVGEAVLSILNDPPTEADNPEEGR